MKDMSKYTILRSILNIILTLEVATSTMQVADILELSIATFDRWHFQEITFLDLFDDGLEENLVKIHNHLLLQTGMKLIFISSKSMNNCSNVLRDGVTQGAVMVNSEDPELLRQVSMGLLESLTWFVPAGINLDNINLRLDSNMYLFSKKDQTITLQEVYSVMKGPKIRDTIGSWTAEQGLKLQRPEIWERRKDAMSSVILVNALVRANSSYAMHFAGYMAEQLEELSVSLKFNVVEVTPADGQYGMKTKNGSWNGIMGMLEQKQADMSSIGFSTSLYRSSQIDVTVSFHKTQSTMVIRKPSIGEIFNVSAYLLIFANMSWFVIVLSVLACVICIIIVGQFEKDRFTIGHSLGLVFISLLQRDRHCKGTRNSTKAAIWIACIHLYLIFSYYSQDLTSYMTVLDPPIQIKSFSDVLNQEYKMIAGKGTQYENLLVTAKPPSILHEIYQKKMKNRPETLVDNVIEVLQKSPMSVCFCNPEMVYGEKDLVVLKLPESFNSYLGISLQKNSEFTKLFNHYLLKMEQSGINKQINRKWFSQENGDYEQTGRDSKALVLNYDNLIFLYILLSLGAVSAVVSIILEIMWHSFTRSAFIIRVRQKW